MSSQLSYRLHGREQRPKTLRKHYRDELDTGQVKASAKEPRACSARRLVMGRGQFSAPPLLPVKGHYAGGRSQVATTTSDQTFLRSMPVGTPVDVSSGPVTGMTRLQPELVRSLG